MTIYFAGGEPDVVTPYNMTLTTDATYFDDDFSRVALYSGSSPTVTLSSTIGDSSADGWWAHFVYYITAEVYNEDVAYFYDGSGNVIAHLDWRTGVLRLTYYTHGPGSSQPFYAALTNKNISQLYLVDVHSYTQGGSSICDIYFDSVLVCQAVIATNSNNGLGKVTFYGAVSYISEIIISDKDTRGARLKTFAPIADGHYTGMSGGYADIDETTPDGAKIAATATGQFYTYTVSGFSSNTSLIRAASINGYVSGDGTNDLQAVVRKGDTDYPSSNLGCTASLAPAYIVHETDPSTGDGWNGDDLQSTEFGYASV